MVKIAIVGAAGRMGRVLVRQVLATPGATLFGASDRPESPALGSDAAVLAGLDQPSGIVVTDDPVPLFAYADAVIDFTSPAATVEHAALAAQGKTAHIIGTTGLSADDEAALHRAARHTPIVYAANYSVGVTILSALVERVAGILDADYDIEIVEMHHRLKVDSPSGTALALGRAAAEGRRVALDSVACRSRDGHVGARPPGEIGFATLRGGDVVGEHSVVFAGTGERIELTHKASSRDIFGRGAVRAALWAAGRKPGLYSMFDVLGFAPPSA
jgi:4-hydroxy-tetrahydrodipicolinate reductase